MRVIFNADDFGFSKGLNLGILEAYKNGVITSTTIMANMNSFQHAVKVAKENSGLGVGIHLVLTKGKAVAAELSSIVDNNGMFFNQDILKSKMDNHEIDIKEVELEFNTQIEKLISSGIYPTHIDSHHHIHLLPVLFEMVLNLAKKYNVPIRINDRNELPEQYKDIKTVDRFYEDFYDENVSLETILNIIKDNTADVIEIMSHPAYVDEELYIKSIYVIQRIKELSILTSEELKNYLTDNHIELINYKQF